MRHHVSLFYGKCRFILPIHHKGITAFSVYTKDIQVIYKLTKKHQLKSTNIQVNEVNKQAFFIDGPT